MVEMAKERMNGRAAIASAENGKSGGRPRKSESKLPSANEVYEFAAENGLDEAFAREWYEMTVVERGGNDRTGNPIANWKGACRRYVKKRIQNMEEQE